MLVSNSEDAVHHVGEGTLLRAGPCWSHYIQSQEAEQDSAGHIVSEVRRQRERERDGDAQSALAFLFSSGPLAME